MIRQRSDRVRSLGVERCCQVLEVSRSEYYAARTKSERVPCELDSLVQAVADKRPAYGYRTISARLRKDGHDLATHKRVRLSMRRLGLVRRPRRRWTCTTTPGKGPAAPNLAAEIQVTEPRRLLVTDFTYVALPGQFGYVSVILDACSRKALGWSVSESIDTDLAKASLSMVFANHTLEAGWVHHSDRGSQYTSQEYREFVLKANGVLSNSRKGNPYDNAKMESFFKTYKCEEAHLAQYDSLEDLKASLQIFLEDYNSERLHSSLGYCSPTEYENLHAEQKQMCVR